MKKLIVFALVLAMALAVPTAVLADSFISSPSNQKAPTTEEDGVTVTGFGDRNTLPEDAKGNLETAYEDIKKAENVSDLTDGLKDAEDAAVSNLFDISGTEEGDDVELTIEDGKDFKGLLFFDGEEWHVVEDAKVDGNKLSFKSMGDGTYAIVSATEKDAPPTGEALPMGFIALAVLCGAAGVCFFVKSKANA